jgi:hypothetical protein
MGRGRLKARGGLQAELFPFLAVLSCMIGTLILVIILVTSGVLGNRRAITLVARDAQGENLSLQPRYIEVRSDGVLLHPGEEFVPRSQIRSRTTALRQLLEEVQRNRTGEYVIVAVRPDGFELFETVRDQVEGRGIKIGYEPIDTDWTLRIR